MIDKLDFENYPVPVIGTTIDNLGATRSSSSSTSRSTSSSSLSFTERLKAAMESAASTAKKIQATVVTSRNPEATPLTTQTRNSTPHTATTPRTAPTSTTTTGSRSGESNDGTKHAPTTGQSPRASQARTPEENNNVVNGNRYLTRFKAMAKMVEEQGFVLTQAQHKELQEIIAQYQKFKGDEATLNLMMQYSQLPVEGGISSDNPLMAAFGNMDTKKAIIIGGVILGIAVLKKATASGDKRKSKPVKRKS